MKKKVLVIGLCTLLVCVCGKSVPKLSHGDDAVVTLSNGEKISVNDLYNDLKANYALDSLINLVDKKILEDKYKDKLESAKEYADSTMKSLKENYGDDLLSAIQSYTSYSTVEAYESYVYLSYLQNLAVEDYAKAQISDKERKEYYEKNIYGDVLVDHILVTPNVKDDATDEEKKKAEDEAKEKINTIIAKLKESKNVKETFTELAKEYSEDESTKNEGGSLGYINDGTLSNSYDEIIKAAFNLKNGEFSNEVITTELGYHVILREEQKEKASFDDVKDTITEKLANNLMTTDATVSIKALQNLRKEYNLDIIDSDIKDQYAKYIQNALTAAQKNNTQNTK